MSAAANFTEWRTTTALPSRFTSLTPVVVKNDIELLRYIGETVRVAQLAAEIDDDAGVAYHLAAAIFAWTFVDGQRNPDRQRSSTEERPTFNRGDEGSNPSAGTQPVLNQ